MSGLTTIIAGSRTCTDYDVLLRAIAECPWEIGQVLSGCEGGVDQLGIRWARQHGIPVDRFPADVERLGRRAGRIRNVEMAEGADALLAIWDGESGGTADMIKKARKQGLKVHVYLLGIGEGQ